MIYGFIMCIWYCHFMQVDTNIDSLHIISQILEWVCISIYLVIYYLRFTFSSLKEVSVAVLNATGPLSNWSFSNNILPGDLSFSFCLQTYILHVLLIAYWVVCNFCSSSQSWSWSTIVHMQIEWCEQWELDLLVGGIALTTFHCTGCFLN